MRARDVMTSPAITVGTETEVGEIARTLAEKRISAVPVVDEADRLVGMVSEGDLMRHVDTGEARPRSWWLRLFEDRTTLAEHYTKERGRFAREVMTRSVISVPEDSTLPEIATLLEEHGIKRVPVVKNGAVTGIVSRANLIHGIGSMKETSQTARSDGEVRTAILEEVKRAEIRADFVNIIVDDGVAHLWGAVASRQARDALVVVAENTSGVDRIENHLYVLDSRIQAAMGGGV